MGEEQSTVSGGGGPWEARIPAGGSAGQPESPRPRGDRAGAPRPRFAAATSSFSSEASSGGCGRDLDCVDASAREPASNPATAGQPAGLPLTGPLDPQSLELQLEREAEGAGPREATSGQQLPDGLLLDVLAQRHPPPAKPQVFCSVYCVESDLPEAPTAESLSPPESPPRAPPGPIPASPPPSFPSSPLSLPADPLSPDGGSIELEFYLAPEPFSVPGLLGAPPYSGLGGVGDPYAPLMVLMCRVCLEDKPIKPLPCCKKAVCEECLKIYLSAQVQLGQVEIKCPITECFEFLEETTVVYNLTHEDSIKYKYFLELGRIDSSTKPCPQCKHFTTFKKKGHIPTPSRSESRYKIQCPTCQFIWCFKCHAPWHEGVNCKEYKKGDKLLRHWASEIEHGQRNAQKCPKCKIHIQRTEGCDHMTCSQCNTNFCYRCGERYRQLRFFGDHTSNLSIFGCKYRYLPERPHLRRLVRGSVCGLLETEPLQGRDEDAIASADFSSTLSEEEKEELKAELVQLEDEITTLRQVLSAKERHLVEIKQKLGMNLMNELKQNFSRSWHDMQTTTAYKKTHETLSHAGQKATAAFSNVGTAISKKFGDMRSHSIGYSIRHSISMPAMRNSPTFKSFEERVETTVTSLKTKVGGTNHSGGSFEEVLNSTAHASSQNASGGPRQTPGEELQC